MIFLEMTQDYKKTEAIRYKEKLTSISIPRNSDIVVIV